MILQASTRLLCNGWIAVWSYGERKNGNERRQYVWVTERTTLVVICVTQHPIEFQQIGRNTLVLVSILGLQMYI